MAAPTLSGADPSLWSGPRSLLNLWLSSFLGEGLLFLSIFRDRRRNYLKNNPNIKVSEENLLGTVKSQDNDTGPNVIFLEKEKLQAGLTHILEDDLEVRLQGHLHERDTEDFKKSFDLPGNMGKDMIVRLNRSFLNKQQQNLLLTLKLTHNLEIMCNCQKNK